MKELELKYGCNPNQKPSRIFVKNGELPIEVLSGRPALISLPIYVGSIPTVLAGLVIAFVLTAVLTYVLGFDENIEKDQKAIDAEKKNVI